MINITDFLPHSVEMYNKNISIVSGDQSLTTKIINNAGKILCQSLSLFIGCV